MGCYWVWQYFCNSFHCNDIERQPSIEDLSDQKTIVSFFWILWYFKSKSCDYFLNSLFILWLNILENIPNGFQNEINTYGPVILVSWLVWKLFGFGIKIIISPKILWDFLRFFVDFFSDKGSKAIGCKSPVIDGRTEDDIAFLCGEEEFVLQFLKLFTFLNVLLIVWWVFKGL